MFDLELFKSECAEAASSGAGQQAIREIVARAVEAPGAVLNSLGEPRRAEVKTLHQSADLTILNVIWGPRMTVMPHNHNMWAVIGIYTGREDNILWRRRPDAPGSRIEAAGAKALGERDTLPLGRDIIHSVTNPIGRLTGAIHVYGGDFFGVPRSEWDPERLVEQPLERSPVTREQGLQWERLQVQSVAVVSKRKLTSRRNNKHHNRDRPNNSKRWILLRGHFPPAWIPRVIR